MKNYKLKRWYPSLHEDIEEGIEVEYKDGWIYYVNTRGNKTCVEFDEYEFNFTDYWEEVKQPLFVTDDGVEVFEGDSYYTVTKPYFAKTELKTKEMPYENSDFKYFFHESNADEYIWRNKPVFSYHEIWKYAPYGSTLSIFEKLAKERAGNEK